MNGKLLPLAAQCSRVDSGGSASAPFSALQALLGLYPYAPASVLFVDPRPPEWLPEITVNRLQIGNATTTLRFFRTADGGTDYQILQQEGTLHVIRRPDLHRCHSS